MPLCFFDYLSLRCLRWEPFGPASFRKCCRSLYCFSRSGGRANTRRSVKNGRSRPSTAPPLPCPPPALSVSFLRLLVIAEILTVTVAPGSGAGLEGRWEGYPRSGPQRLTNPSLPPLASRRVRIPSALPMPALPPIRGKPAVTLPHAWRPFSNSPCRRPPFESLWSGLPCAQCVMFLRWRNTT